MNNKETVKVSNNGDYWVCLCYNNTMSSGFDTCDKNGKDIEPLSNVWTGSYACLECGRIIDQDTYEVVSKTDDLSAISR